MTTEGVAGEVVARGVAAVGDECQCQSLHCRVCWRRGGIRMKKTRKRVINVGEIVSLMSKWERRLRNCTVVNENLNVSVERVG